MHERTRRFRLSLKMGKCKNCGKLEKNHYLGSEDGIGGVWCRKISKVKPTDEEYFMSYNGDSHKN